MPGPLEGLLAIEVGWGMPAAVTGMLLADYGATVVKIERPGGGPDRQSVTRSCWDRGKSSVEADLNSEAGREALQGLLAGADVFVESLGPGVAAERGMGYPQMHDLFPELIYCSISAYGQDGPLRDRPGYDALVAARMGFMAEQPGSRKGPVFLGHPTLGYGTGLLATIGVLAALRVRHFTGTGQQVDASMLDTVIAESCMNWWWNEGDDSYLARSGNEKGFGRARIITDPFRCRDGEYLMIHTGGAGAFKRTMDILGLGDKVRPIEGMEMAVRLDDDEYHAARHLVPSAFLSRPRAEWLELFQTADVAALPVLRPGEVLLDEQVTFAQLVAEVPDPHFGTLRQVSPVIRFSSSPAGAPRPAPRVGEHNGLLDQFNGGHRGRKAAAVTPDAPRHALEGLKVLDFSSFFAAAFGARLLSDLGADVIKVETPGGDQMRPLPDPFEGAQRGKRTIAIDLRAAAGRDVVYDLVRTADVVLHNLRPGKAERLGIGYDELSAINPALIYCYQPGFGAQGPKALLKSFAPLLAGFTGLLYEAAGAGNEPARRTMGNEDYYNGFLGATAVLMALEHRQRTGCAQYIEIPQLHASLFVASHHCLDQSGNVLSGPVLDQQQMGWGPLYRIYRTDDGWICVACVGDAAFANLCRALGVERLLADAAFATSSGRHDNGEALAAELSARFETLSTEDAFATLDGAGVPCEVVKEDPYMPDFLWDEWALGTGRVFEQHHALWGWIRELGHVVHLSDTPGPNKGPSPLLGEHTREILHQLDYGPERVDELLGSVCIAYTPKQDP